MSLGLLLCHSHNTQSRRAVQIFGWISDELGNISDDGNVHMYEMASYHRSHLTEYVTSNESEYEILIRHPLKMISAILFLS